MLFWVRDKFSAGAGWSAGCTSESGEALFRQLYPRWTYRGPERSTRQNLKSVVNPRYFDARCLNCAGTVPGHGTVLELCHWIGHFRQRSATMPCPATVPQHGTMPERTQGC